MDLMQLNYYHLYLAIDAESFVPQLVDFFYVFS